LRDSEHFDQEPRLSALACAGHSQQHYFHFCSSRVT
jgi:hypothetical protein